ncbi:hypothetical protein A4R44_08320 [Amycolatopsis sp. M39]|nr:hypothetical protein A4R44_08320 [Amycolatopsis sp. M39]
MHHRVRETERSTHRSAQLDRVQKLVPVLSEETGGVRDQRRPFTHSAAVPVTCDEERVVYVDHLSIRHAAGIKAIGHRPPDRLDIAPSRSRALLLIGIVGLACVLLLALYFSGALVHEQQDHAEDLSTSDTRTDPACRTTASHPPRIVSRGHDLHHDRRRANGCERNRQPGGHGGPPAAPRPRLPSARRSSVRSAAHQGGQLRDLGMRGRLVGQRGHADGDGDTGTG